MDKLVQYATGKKGATSDYKVEWEATRLLLLNKMFGMLGAHKDGRAIITLKILPSNGAMLREEYKGKIIEGYYMNKLHWISIYLDSDVPQTVIKAQIDEAYALVFAGLSKKMQQIITTENS